MFQQTLCTASAGHVCNFQVSAKKAFIYKCLKLIVLHHLCMFKKSIASNLQGCQTSLDIYYC